MAKAKKKIRRHKVVILDYGYREWISTLKRMLVRGVEVEILGSGSTENFQLLAKLLENPNARCIWVYDLTSTFSQTKYKEENAVPGGCTQHWLGILGKGKEKPKTESRFKRTLSKNTTPETLAQEVSQIFKGVEA